MIFNGPYKIVIIDDDEDTCFLLENWLHKSFEQEIILKFFNDAMKGIDYIDTNEVHIVICDIHLGDARGEDLISICSGMDKGIKTIALSADKSITTSVECFTNGASYFIDKPINQMVLTQVVQKCIDHFIYWHQVMQSRVEQHKKQTA
jgi:DNA-binding NtrC family response regulator